MRFQDFLTSNTIIEALCFITAAICLPRDKFGAWRYFSVYLFITCVTELYAIYLKKHHHNNQWPYNISIIFEAVFISGMFANIFKRYFNSRIFISAGLLLLFVLYLVDLYIHGFMRLNNITNNTMSVLFSLYALGYFYLLLKDDRYINLKFSAGFWWVTGVLFFYFGGMAVNLYRGINESIAKQNLCAYIFNLFIIIMYSCWSYSFICKRWLTTISKT